ncbi:MAG: hypothetical protein WBM17_10770 [Anaerolineales bacterium]
MVLIGSISAAAAVLDPAADFIFLGLTLLLLLASWGLIVLCDRLTESRK